MLITVDHHSGVPVFRQIIDQVKFHITGGLLKAGDELPSTRALSARLELNPMTVSKAYSLLEAEGWVERKRGRPLTVKARPAENADREKIDQLAPQMRSDQHLLINLSGRGDKDMHTVAAKEGLKL